MRVGGHLQASRREWHVAATTSNLIDKLSRPEVVPNVHRRWPSATPLAERYSTMRSATLASQFCLPSVTLVHPSQNFEFIRNISHHIVTYILTFLIIVPYKYPYLLTYM